MHSIFLNIFQRLGYQPRKAEALCRSAAQRRADLPEDRGRRRVKQLWISALKRWGWTNQGYIFYIYIYMDLYGILWDIQYV